MRKNCLCKHFLQNIVLWSKKRTWFVKQIHITTNVISFIQARKNCLCKHFLQNIVLWSKKERDLSSKYILQQRKNIHSRGLYWSFIRNKYLYPRVPPFREKIAYVSIFYKISSCGAKKERDLSSKYTLQRKNSVYTQWDYSGLSNEINIYIPEFHHFEKKLLM